MRRDAPIRVVVLGLPGAGRTETACRLVEALLAGGGGCGGPTGSGARPLGRRASLPALGRELALRGLQREDPAARPGARTTRQVLDAVLRHGERSPGHAEDASLFVEVGGRVIEVVDAAGARLRDDALDPAEVHPLGALERAGRAFVFVLPYARWAGGGDADGLAAGSGAAGAAGAAGAGALDRGERDRVEQSLARIARAAGRRRVPLALIVSGAPPAASAEASRPHGEAARDAARGAPSREAASRDAAGDAVRDAAGDAAALPPAVRALAAGLDPARFEVVAEALPREPRPGELARVAALLLDRLDAGARRPAARVARALAAGALALALAAAAGLGVGIARVAALTAEPLGDDATREQTALEEALSARAFWARVPLVRAWAGAPLDTAIRARAEHLAALVLGRHPAALEPLAACQLKVAQYRTAADALALADRVLGDGARAEVVLRLREKARVRAMPAPTRDSLPAWEELWASTPVPALRDGVVAQAIRGVLALLAREAESEARALDRYPDLLAPVRAVERAHPPLAGAAFDEAQARLWPLAAALVLADGERAATGRDALDGFVDALARAPEPPPASFAAPVGRALGEALVRAALEGPVEGPSEARATALARLGEGGLAALLAAVPPAYARLAASGNADGEGARRLEGLRRALAWLPRAALPEAHAERARALARHLDDLYGFGRYGVRVIDVEVPKDRFWTWRDGYDLTFEIGAARAPVRRFGPYENQVYRDISQWAWQPGELTWRAWDALWVVVADDERSEAGFAYRDDGHAGPFGLHLLGSGTYRDPGGRGRFRVEVQPAPPAPFDLAGWPGAP